MDFKQSYKGIFQFESQAALEMAMSENQAEAVGADALGFQDSYHAEGVMLLDIDATASENDWEEMLVAIATLAMHASKGFLVASAIPKGGEPKTELFYANPNKQPLGPENSDALPDEENYFPLIKGSNYTFKATNRNTDSVHWSVNTIKAHGSEFYYFTAPEAGQFEYDDYSHSAFFQKKNALVCTVHASNQEELASLDFSDPYASQVIYNNNGKPTEELYLVWNPNNVFGIFAQEGFVDLELPMGSFANCMKVRAELYHVEGANMSKEVHYEYFAKGIGLVKWEKGDAKLELSAFTK
ncbi:MAG TPA: hypothetical protein ENJ82_17160 [Bacteroidetes bacterium]|nr:hypothetical protein [Bacteroidota bacterium]